ncbi:MAG: InlB B-repeat-containing protein, partial [Fibrobacterales bacterium]|nr:InlB B-repeat-containing protein [Fibrobacterales bacterium]
ATFHAVWTLAPTYTVVFDVNGHGAGTTVSSLSAQEGSAIAAPAAPADPGYDFGGWYLEQACANAYDFASPVNSNFTLYAKWTAHRYSVTYNLNGGTNSAANPSSYTMDTAAFALAAPTREGHVFAGWYADGEYTDVVAELPPMKPGNIALYARWHVNEYPVVYRSGRQGNGQITDAWKRWGEPLALSSDVFTRPGYVQDGWSTVENDTAAVYALGASYTADSALALYPHWVPGVYSITYVDPEGMPHSNPATYTVESAFTLQNPTGTVNGKKFAGWYLEPSFVNKVTAMKAGDGAFRSNDPRFVDKTLYAKWTQIALTVTTTGGVYEYDGTAHGATVAVSFGADAGLYRVDTASSSAAVTDVTASPVAVTCDRLVVVNKSTGEDATSAFNVVYVDGTVEVTPREVEFVGATDTLAYTGAEQTLSAVEAEGLVAGHTTNVVYSASGTDVGDYAGSITDVGDVRIADSTGRDVTANYLVSTLAGWLTIKKAASFEIALESDTVVYDGAAHATSKIPTTTAAGTTTFEYRFAGDADWVSDLASLAKTDAGSYAIELRASNPGYDSTAAASAALVVAPRPVSVAVVGDAENVQYDGTEHYAKGYVLSTADAVYDTADVAFAGTDSVAGTNVGIYAMGLAASQFSNGNPNFDVSFGVTDGYLKVTSGREVVVTIAGHNGSATYDGTEHKVGGFDFSSDNALYTIADVSFSGSDTARGTDAGVHAMGLAASQFSNTNPNFDDVVFVVTDGSLTVNPIATPIVVTAASASKTYDGAALSDAGYTYTENVLVSGDVLSATVEGSIVGAGETANTVTAVTVTRGGDDVTANYTIGTPVAGTLTVSKAPLAVATRDSSKVYDGTALRSGASISGLVNGETATVAATDSQTVVGSRENGYAISWGPADSANYAVTATKGTLTITPRAATITVANATKKYGETDPAFTGSVSGLVDENDLGAISYRRTDTTGKDAGTYNGVLTALYTANPNYEVTVVPGNLKINKRAVTLTSGSGEKIYDGRALVNSEIVVGGDGFATMEGATYTFTGSQLTVGSSENLFSYKLFTGNAANYSISRIYGTLTVLPRTDTVVVAIRGQSASFVYSANTQRISGYSVTISDPVYAESDFAFSGDASAEGADAGTYGMGLEASQFANLNANFANVRFDVTDGVLTIDRRPVVVAALGAEKTYGTADPELEASVTGLLRSSPISYAVTRAAGEDVGEYAITPAGDAVQGNYSVTYVPGTFTINPAAVSIVVDASGKKYGEADPAFSGTVT